MVNELFILSAFYSSNYAYFSFVNIFRHKNSIRVEEIKTLLQGGKLLTVALCATEPLLSANDRPTQSSQLSNHMVFEEPQDNTGLAQVRRRQSAPSNNEDNLRKSQEEIAKKPEIDQCTIVVIENPELLISPAISRTTAWRKRKNPLTGSAGKDKEQERKAYTCNKCQQPMTTTNGHSQFRGQRYCPNTETLTKQEWLEVKKNEKKK
jgi:hypothetical protein